MVKVGYALLLVAALCWIAFMVAGMVRSLPYGAAGLCALAGTAVLFFRVVRDRLANEEDEYYSKNVRR